MRYRLLHVAAVLVHRGRELIMRLDETWPWASELATAFARLRAAFPQNYGSRRPTRSDSAGRDITRSNERPRTLTSPVRS